MKPEKFLKLIGAPWSAYHDHPNEPGIAIIRPTGEERYFDDVCIIYGTNSTVLNLAAVRCARRDLIARAPRMYAYVASMAATGDTEAKLILRTIRGGSDDQ